MYLFIHSKYEIEGSNLDKKVQKRKGTNEKKYNS